MLRLPVLQAIIIGLVLILGAGCSPPPILPSGTDEDTEPRVDTIEVSPDSAPPVDTADADRSETTDLDGAAELDSVEPELPCDPGHFCDDKECGPDPCGGTCKTQCWAHQACFAWVCRDEGEMGFPCEADDECDSGHCVPWEEGAVCTDYCGDADVCHPDWTCGFSWGTTFCLPPCEPITCEDLGAACGAPEDGCGVPLDCGVCEGENEVCGEDWTCVCEFAECGGVCCDDGDSCNDGACWSGPVPCVPPCVAGEHCTDLGICVPCCTFGQLCGEGIECEPGLVCTGAICCYATDATCDGIDDDCDGVTDDDYISDNTCGEGPCLIANTPSTCVSGQEIPCEPGTPLAVDDVTCDGVDDDCDGETDEEYVVVDDCGTGSCLAANTPSTCENGLEIPCQPGEALASDDATCDGVDDDCDGDTDEEYVVVDDCGTGWCETDNLASACVDGFEIPCQPGAPLAVDDATCDGADEDCDGETDEDYPVDDSCGVGACQLFNTPSSCEGGVDIPCVPAQAADLDTICNNLDDDCDGATDEDYFSDDACGKGWCRTTNVPSTCEDGLEILCVPGQPLADIDVSCDEVDSDCDGMTDEDADPPCSFGAPVVGATVVFESEGGLPSGIVTDNGDGTYVTEVVDLFESGLEGSVSATAGDQTAAPMGFTLVSGVPAETVLHLSRSQVHADAPQMRACLHTVDALDAPAGPGLEAGFDLDIGEQQLEAEAEYAGDGFYCAWLELPASVFLDDTTGSVTGWIEGLTSAPGEFVALAAPYVPELDEGEVAITLPLGPVLPGTTFQVPVIVNTGSHTVSAYNLSVNFDIDVLEVISVDQGAAADLSPPASNAGIDANQTGALSFNGINQNPSGDTAQGPGVELAVISFSVREDATPGLPGAVSGTVHELIDLFMADFSASPDITVRGPAGSGIIDQVTPSTTNLRAIQVLLNPRTLLDLSALTGEAPGGLIRVVAFCSDGSLSPADEWEPVCDVSDPGVALEAGCAVTATGAGVSEVTAVAGDLEAHATLRVAGLVLPMEAAALDSKLQYMFDLDQLQSTRVRVLGQLSDGDLIDFLLDLTHEVGFSSSDEDIAAVDQDGRITPDLNGVVDIHALGYDGTTVGTTSVQVAGGDTVQVEDLMVVIPARVEMMHLDPEPIPTTIGATVATAKVTNLITGEGSQVQSRAILIFSDDGESAGGSRLDITDMGLVSYQAGIASIGVVDQNGVVTATGAGETDVQAEFTSVWGDTVADDTQAFSVELPPPVSVEVSASDPRVAQSAMDRAWTVLGVPYQRPLTVTVFFEDGGSLDMSTDPRTHYEVSDGIAEVTDAASCAGDPACVPGVAMATDSGTGTFTVTVTFPGTYMEDLEGTIELEVVAHEGLVLQSLETYTPPGETPVPEQVLSLVEGTSAWQKAALRLADEYSDGTSLDLTVQPGAEFHVYQPGTETPILGVVLIADDGTITAQAAGLVDLVGSHEGEVSAPVILQVSTAKINIVAITASISGSTLQGFKDTDEALVVRGQFQDGTRRLLTGADLVQGLLFFQSGDTDTATVSSSGLVTARGNGPVEISIDLNPAADIYPHFDPATIVEIMVNLEPTVGDVDLGEPEDHPFPDQPSDAIFEVPVRVNTGGYLLGGIDLEIEYDPEVLEALGVVAGELPASIFQGNVGEAGKVMINASPVVGELAYGSALEVARITFKALKGPDGPMVSPIGGTIRGFINTGGTMIGPPTPRSIIAGDGELDPPPVEILGDANDDESFDIKDILFLQWIVANPPIQLPNTTQEAQSDLFPDGILDIRDAWFASQSLARMVHFVEMEAVSTGPGEFDLKAWVVDRDQTLVSDQLSVRLEVTPGNNLGTIQFTLPHQQTASGLLTDAVLLDDGAWGTHVSGLSYQEAMGVVVIMETLDWAGEVMMTTPFLTTPYLDPDAMFTPVFYFGETW